MTTTEQSIPDIAFSQDGDTDALFDVLSNPRRRFVLACLTNHSKPMAVADVADELTRWECDTSRGQLPEDEVLSRYTALHHVHVPKMADIGLIKYNQDKKTVALVDDYAGIKISDFIHSEY